MSLKLNANDAGWAWAPFEPDATHPWNLALAGHLYRRAAFGATWEQLQQALTEGPQATLNRLLHPPAEAAAFERARQSYEDTAALSNAPEMFVAWWLRRLLETPDPWREQMTLFWHNHFALSNGEVNSTALMGRYLGLLRREALGRFDTLFAGLLAEPALYAGLDARANRKAQPNLQLPRVLMEHYTLGPGVGSEQDIREAARAFTGWFVSPGQLQLLAYEHDTGVKQVLGQAGAFEAKDIGRLLPGHPATAPWLVGRLYRWLISETEPPPAGLLAPLAAEFARDFNLGRVAETMLRSNLFFSSTALHQKVKSPLEFMLSLVRPLQGSLGTLHLGGELAALGQDLLEPPTTRGWAGHRYWINAFTLSGRARFARNLLSPGGAYASTLDPARLAAAQGHRSPEAAGRFFCQLFCQDILPEKVSRQAVEAAFGPKASAQGDLSNGLRHLVALLAAQPEFHLA